jgi:hypothetical protein
MKTQINEIKRMQQLAGILNENQQNSITDFCNTNFRKLEKIFGKIGSKFEPTTLSNGIEVAYAGIDGENGIDISFDPRYEEMGNIYNDIEDYDVAGKTIYVNDYLSEDDEEEDY